MSTNQKTDNTLLAKAQKLGKHETHQETVNAALAYYLKRWEPIFKLGDKKKKTKGLTEADVEREIAAVRAKRRGKA